MSKGEKNSRKKDKPSRPSGNDSQALHSLLVVGSLLSSENKADKILDIILEEAVLNCNADGGSIYLVEKAKQDNFGGVRPNYRHVLRTHRIMSRTLKQEPNSIHQLEVDEKTISGYVAMAGKPVRIRDAYNLPTDSPFKFDPSNWDRVTGYRTKSILTVPMITNKGRVIGVVQLVNKLRPNKKYEISRNNSRVPEKCIIAFSEDDERLMQTFAAQAAVALDNAKLTDDISKLFESFVKASVTAIESRDPSTSGHSDRVADLTVYFAERVDSIQIGQYSSVKFTPDQIKEIRYAALLHDFGKIGVKENILLKAKKLFPLELETINLRIDTLKAKNEARMWRELCERFVYQSLTGPDAETEVGRALWKIDSFARQLEEIRKGIFTANEPQVMAEDFDIDRLMAWVKKMSQDLGQNILQPEESARLMPSKGTLGPSERKEIESHVSHTYEFLKQIHWTEDLANVPDIAHAHHEKLDGTGYPLGIKADLIPIQSRLMTISDIYDALTAMDRPYKKAVSTERAIEILHIESGEGKLDKGLLKIFVEAEIYKVVETKKYKTRKAA